MTGTCAVGAGIEVTGTWVVSGSWVVTGICVVARDVTGTACVIGGGGGTVALTGAVTGTAWVIGGALRLFLGAGWGCWAAGWAAG